MKPFLKRFFKTIFIIIFAAALIVLGFFINKFDLDKLKPIKLVEQIPFGQVVEVTGYEDAEFYDSKNEFIGAEIRIRVEFESRIEPAVKLPVEYKQGVRKAYSDIDIYVKDIESKEQLEKMKQALEEIKYLKLIEGEGVQADYVEKKIDGKKIKSLAKLYLKPDNYYFVKY
jgi:head-tail adaptor